MSVQAHFGFCYHSRRDRHCAGKLQRAKLRGLLFGDLQLPVFDRRRLFLLFGRRRLFLLSTIYCWPTTICGVSDDIMTQMTQMLKYLLWLWKFLTFQHPNCPGSVNPGFRTGRKRDGGSGCRGNRGVAAPSLASSSGKRTANDTNAGPVVPAPPAPGVPLGLCEEARFTGIKFLVLGSWC